MNRKPPKPWPRIPRATAVPLGLVLIGLLVLGFNAVLEWRAGYAYRRIQKGDSEARVRLYLGEPSRFEACGDPLWWDQDNLGKNDGRCVRYARYDYHHSSYGVGYSADHVVVAKHHYVD